MKAVVSNSSRKLLRVEISKMMIAVLKNKLIVPFVIIFGKFRSLLHGESGFMRYFDIFSHSLKVFKNIR